MANNKRGSATGLDSVKVQAGTLGGEGIILGPVTIGTCSGSGAVLAASVAIESGAQFNFLGSVQGKLRQGTNYPLISNTASIAISGTFANLPDGAVLSVGHNHLQASYEGGDGNDLTLTVVP